MARSPGFRFGCSPRLTPFCQNARLTNESSSIRDCFLSAPKCKSTSHGRRAMDAASIDPLFSLVSFALSPFSASCVRPRNTMTMSEINKSPVVGLPGATEKPQGSSANLPPPEQNPQSKDAMRTLERFQRILSSNGSSSSDTHKNHARKRLFHFNIRSIRSAFRYPTLPLVLGFIPTKVLSSSSWTTSIKDHPVKPC